MPRINVTKPFKATFERGVRRDFTLGEHELTEDELKHWFVQGCIAEGRATLLPDETKPEAQAKAEPQAKVEPQAKAKASSSEKAKK